MSVSLWHSGAKIWLNMKGARKGLHGPPEGFGAPHMPQSRVLRQKKATLNVSVFMKFWCSDVTK